MWPNGPGRWRNIVSRAAKASSRPSRRGNRPRSAGVRRPVHGEGSSGSSDPRVTQAPSIPVSMRDLAQPPSYQGGGSASEEPQKPDPLGGARGVPREAAGKRRWLCSSHSHMFSPSRGARRRRASETPSRARARRAVARPGVAYLHLGVQRLRPPAPRLGSSAGRHCPHRGSPARPAHKRASFSGAAGGGWVLPRPHVRDEPLPLRIP